MKSILLSVALVLVFQLVFSCCLMGMEVVHLSGSDVSYYSQIKYSSSVSIATHMKESTGVNSLKAGRTMVTLSGYYGLYNASRIYLSVDLSGMDPSKTVVSATLNLYQLNAGNCGNILFYDYLPGAPDFWAGTPLINAADIATNKSLISSFAPQSNHQFSLDITSAIQHDYLPCINAGGNPWMWSGFIIQVQSEYSGSGYEYASFDYLNSPITFDLVLDTPVPEPVTILLLGLGILGVVPRVLRKN